MPLPDWRDDRVYDHFDDLDVSGLAWECLRRNERYEATYPLMLHGRATPADWGLRFPRRSEHRRTHRARLLARRYRTRSRQSDRAAA